MSARPVPPHVIAARTPRPDHVEASITLLSGVVDSLRAGKSPEDLGPQVILIGRLMARQT